MTAINQVVKVTSDIWGEIKAWWRVMGEGISLLKSSTLRAGSANVFFILFSLIEGTYVTLPRTLTCLTVSSLLAWGSIEIASWMM